MVKMSKSTLMRCLLNGLPLLFSGDYSFFFTMKRLIWYISSFCLMLTVTKMSNLYEIKG